MEQVDILLAELAAEGGQSAAQAFHWQKVQRLAAIAGALRFEGTAATLQDVQAVLVGTAGRFPQRDPVHGLAKALDAALEKVEEHATAGRLPDGPFLLDLWRILVQGLPGPWPGNTRTEDPRDALAWLPYAEPEALPGLLSRLTEAQAFLDFPPLFRSLHPIRQATRLFFRVARIAPFRDHNLLMAWLAACGYLRARGYPILVLDGADRAAVERQLAAGPPRAFPPWEARLLETVRRMAAQAAQ